VEVAGEVEVVAVRPVGVDGAEDLDQVEEQDMLKAVEVGVTTKVKNSALFHLAQPFSKRYTRYNVLIARYIKN
jgi:hypothetical protein